MNHVPLSSRPNPLRTASVLHSGPPHPRVERLSQDFHFGPGTVKVYTRAAPNTELKAGIDTQGARIEAQITEIKAEIKAQTARIDVLQRVIWRVIWPHDDL